MLNTVITPNDMYPPGTELEDILTDHRRALVEHLLQLPAIQTEIGT